MLGPAFLGQPGHVAAVGAYAALPQNDNSSFQLMAQQPPTWDDGSSTRVSSGTDTDTSSDDGTEAIAVPEVEGMSPRAAYQTLFGNYRRGKKVWRRARQAPTRRVRRWAKRKGGGKARGRRASHFMLQPAVLTYMKGKGKGHRSHTTGKGWGRRRNPIGPDGNVMKCRKCGSEEHFEKDCRGASGPVGLLANDWMAGWSAVPHRCSEAATSHGLAGRSPSPARPARQPPCNRLVSGSNARAA